ncbi:GrpB family protein [Marinimicrobium locisalis]|uniref:GrpB family protein n=1 Tax=Marinimicrobium locisalis TaxID=546022 RepID=UPI0032214216
MKFFEPDKVKDDANLLYRKWKGRIESELPFSRVEHIDSTAINGALTKGDVDLYVEVALEEHEEAVKGLVKRYNALKMGCSACLQEEYRRKKSIFIEGVLQPL